MFCHKITASCVIHEDVGLFLHLRIQSLDKNIGDLILVQCFVQAYMSAQQLTFAGFDDQSVNSLADQLFQESCLLLAAVSCIFQDDTRYRTAPHRFPGSALEKYNPRYM